MSGKLTRKERAEQQRLAQQKVVPAATSQPKKKTVSSAPKGNSLIRGLNYTLIALAAIVYFNSLFNEYALDDYSIILENNQTKEGASAFFKIFGSSYRNGWMNGDGTLYRPLSKAMFALEWSMTKGPGLNHFMNVAMFALSVVLLFKMLRLYMQDTVLVPFLTAVIFAVHPIHTEVIANIKGRDDVMCFLFFVITAIYVYRYTVSQNSKHLRFAAGAFFLCFLSKESAITFIAVIPLMLYFFTDADRKTYLNVGGMLACVTALFLLIRFLVLPGGGDIIVPVVDNYIAGIDGFVTQRTTAIAIAGIYLVKLFVPYSLVCDASIAQIPVYGFGDWQFLVPFLIFLAAFAFAVWKFKSKHPVAFGILYFFITFSLVSNIPFLLGTNYGERLLYAPSLGICLIVAYLIGKFVQREESSAVSTGEFFKRNRNAFAATAVIVVCYSWLTIDRNPAWHDNLTLYTTDLAKSPNSCKMHFYYANHITQIEELSKFPKGSPQRLKIVDTAMVEFKQAIVLYPAFGDAIQKLAEMYYEKKQLDSAEFNYLKAIKLNPTSSMYRSNYGRMLFEQGRLPEAKVQFESAIKSNPGHTEAYNNLAAVYGMQGGEFVNKAKADPARQEEYNAKAMDLYKLSVQNSLKAIATNPNFISAYETTSLTYGMMGDAVNQQKYATLAQQLRNAGRK